MGKVEVIVVHTVLIDGSDDMSEDELCNAVHTEFQLIEGVVVSWSKIPCDPANAEEF